jgi:endo-1,4-beta-xylanase
MREAMRRLPGRAVTAALVLVAATLVAQGPGLKDVAPKGLLLGAAVNGRQSDGADAPATAIVTRHFSSVTPENLLKWEAVHPEADRFAFEPADRFVDFANQHGLVAIGHVLVWHQQTPKWVFESAPGVPATKEQLLARMQDHITRVVGRYKGRIRGWDVVNEALDEDGSLRKSPWLQIAGEEFIAKAFEYAHAADPAAELYYNEYNLWKPEKRAGAIRLGQALKKKGLRVDGIGEQGHWHIEVPSAAEIDATLGDIAKAGFKTHVTELDVDVLPRDPDMWGADLSKKAKIKEATNLYPNGLPAEQQEKLARRYAEIFGLVMKHRESVARVTFWGVTDRTTWLHNFPIPGRTNYPLLFDRDGQPKPALDAVMRVLQGR